VGAAGEVYPAELLSPETLTGDGVEAYEGTLIVLNDVEVTEVRQYDYLVTGSVPVAYKFSPDYQPTVGDKLTSLTGIVDYPYGEYKIQPRSDDDIVVGEKAEVPVTEKTISEIQQDATSTDCTGDAPGGAPTQKQVLTTGIVISPIADVSANLNGVFIGTDPSGPWSGLQVVFGKALQVELNPGDTASFLGNIKEFYCQTEMIAEVINVDEPGGLVPAAAVVTAEDINTNGEQYEGSFVTLENLTVENIDHISDYQEVTLSGDLIVVLKDYQVAWSPKVGEKVVSISGGVKYSFSKYKITPFAIEDIVAGQ
jgi:predicted extracellular nuclease